MKKDEGGDNSHREDKALNLGGAVHVSYKTAAVRTISFWYNEFKYDEQTSHIMTGLYLGMIPHNSPDSILKFVADINPTRPLGLVVSVVEENELKGEGFLGAKMVSPKDWQSKGVAHHLIRMVDFTANVDITKSIETIKKMRACILEGKAVFVHCKAGRSRSAMFCAIYMSLFVDNPITEQKYTLAEALEVLKNAREQVSVGSEKLETAKKIMLQYEQEVNTNALSLLERQDNDRVNFQFDCFLASTSLKEAILKLPAVVQLISYKDTVTQQHKHDAYLIEKGLKSIPKRCRYVDQILQLLTKPHSEEWYYKLIENRGPFGALCGSNPKNIDEKQIDKILRVSLIEQLISEVTDCINVRLNSQFAPQAEIKEGKKLKSSFE